MLYVIYSILKSIKAAICVKQIDPRPLGNINSLFT